MSLDPQTNYPIPEDTRRVARAAFPKGNLYMKMRDELGEVYGDASFAELFPGRGQKAESSGRLAWVTVMQFSEGLSDRQAAEAVRARIDWKYVLGLELDDPGFNYSVLSEFRERLVVGQREQLLLDNLLTRLKELKLLKGRGQQRTDSTHILGAVRQLNRIEIVGETLRQALNELSEFAPEWVQAISRPEWFARYGRRFEQMRLPREPAERQALLVTMTSGTDGGELSIDGGNTWQTVSMGTGDIWSFTWQSNEVPNGQYTLQMRGMDQAGNVGDLASLTLVVDNGPPAVSISERWWIWETGELKVSPNHFPIASVQVTIRDPQNRWPAVVMSFDPDKSTESISWNRRFAAGTLAPSGEYPVVAVACDIHDLCGHDTGIIVIPTMATSTATTTPSPTATITMTPRATFTATQNPATPTPVLVVSSMAIAWFVGFVSRDCFGKRG